MEERSREGRDLTSVAEILAAGDPLVWRRLLAEHTADDLGHCRCCRRDRWPCQAALEQSPRLATDWDNVRVPDVGGQDGEVIPDGELCSAGIARFSGLDLPRTDWPATTLTAGSSFRFDYRATIPHEGSFRLYMTRQGYDP
ncbi:MAG: lytic polysaccharide monooxygenase, partial [Pseudonocardia sp.]|nr:lytic polysaccharide monooxygenase [Pseudonocardia sp.]